MMAFVTFVIALATIAAFYFYSTKPECRKAVNDLSTATCDALKETIIPLKQKEEVPVEARPFDSIGSRLLLRTDTEEKTAVVPGGDTQADTALRSSTLQGQEGGQSLTLGTGAVSTVRTSEKELVTGDKKKRKKSKSKKGSKKKKGSKRNKKKGKKLEEALPEDL
uniref:Uncharacterized protein n=2 Tax=Onchocerca TaxID=6281 RepID=A0A8R1TXW1_ONCVO